MNLRLEKLEKLPLCRSGKAPPITLLKALIDALARPELIEKLKEVRVGRTSRHALFVYVDGSLDEFRGSAPSKPDRFYVESVLPAQLLIKVASEVARRPAERPSR